MLSNRNFAVLAVSGALALSVAAIVIVGSYFVDDEPDVTTHETREQFAAAYLADDRPGSSFEVPFEAEGIYSAERFESNLNSANNSDNTEPEPIEPELTPEEIEREELMVRVSELTDADRNLFNDHLTSLHNGTTFAAIQEGIAYENSREALKQHIRSYLQSGFISSKALVSLKDRSTVDPSETSNDHITSALNLVRSQRDAEERFEEIDHDALYSELSEEVRRELMAEYELNR